MANLTITNTFASNTTISSSQVNQNYTDIKTWLNNRDNATDTWLNVKGATIEATTLLKGKGTSAADSAATGYIGEYTSASVILASAVSSTGTSQWYDVTNISLTAGDWDVSGVLAQALNGATQTGAVMGISSTSGNSSTGLVAGDNQLNCFVPTAAADGTASIPTFRVSIASTTTYYLKAFSVFSAGTPKAYGRISARRTR